MSSIQKFVRLTALLLLVTSVSLYFFLSPNYASRVHYQGQTINITRNLYAIPFIAAPSRKAFLYAYGWVLAEDRAFQMSFRKLVTQGRLAEFLGEQALPMDKFMKEINLGGWGEIMAAKLQSQNSTEYEMFQAMADGINERMLSHTLPLDFHLIGLPWQNWTVASTFKMYKLLQLSQSVLAFEQIYRSSLLVNHTKQQIDSIFPSTKEGWAFDSKVVIQDVQIPQKLRTYNLVNGDHFAGKINPELIQNLREIQNLGLLPSVEGSNSWIIAGKHTQTGKPILASDPHLSNSVPSNFYQIEGCYWKNGKRYCMNAFSIPGSILITGRYNYLAMAPTTIYSDTIDFFKEKVQNDRYLVDGQWLSLNIRKEVIKIKTDQGIRQLEYLIKQTHRGPIVNYYISETGNFELPQNLSMQWTGANDDYTSNLAMFQTVQFDNLQSLKAQLPKTKLFNFNLAIITADGHILNQRYGFYPIRKNPQMGNYIKDGTTTENDWQGYVPMQDLLTIIDPQCGYVVAANNRGAQDLYYNGLHKYHSYTARADRITEMIEDYLGRGIKINAEITKKMVTDTVDSYCRRILPTILKVLPQSADLLNNFDCDFTSHSVTAPVYELFFYELHHLVKKSNFDKVSFMSLHNHYQYLYNYVKKGQESAQNKQVLQAAWRNLLKNPTLSFDNRGKLTKKWGQIHKDVMNHAPFGKSKILSHFYNKEFQGRGNMHTVNVGKMLKITFGNYDVSHRAANRAIFSYEGPNFWIVDSGASQRFYSKHYDDQWKLFKQNQFIQIRKAYSQANIYDQL